jgi:hypothetical protein
MTIETLNSIQTLNYIKFRNNNKRKLTSKQEKSNKYLENCMTDCINKKITSIEYLKKISFELTNHLFCIYYILLFVFKVMIK